MLLGRPCHMTWQPFCNRFGSCSCLRHCNLTTGSLLHQRPLFGHSFLADDRAPDLRINVSNTLGQLCIIGISCRSPLGTAELVRPDFVRATAHFANQPWQDPSEEANATDAVVTLGSIVFVAGREQQDSSVAWPICHSLGKGKEQNITKSTIQCPCHLLAQVASKESRPGQLAAKADARTSVAPNSQLPIRANRQPQVQVRLVIEDAASLRKNQP